jgi:hypothetical protein
MIILSEEQYQEDRLWRVYLAECIRTRDFTHFTESRLDEGVKDVWRFIKELATRGALKIADLVKAFKNKYIFNIFKEFNFDPSLLGEAVKKVYELVKQVTHFLPNVIAKSIIGLGKKSLTDSQKSAIIDAVNKVDKWKRGLGKLGNLVFGLFILQAFLVAGLSGDVLFDFNADEPIDAFRGRLQVAEFFLGDNGDGTNKDGSVSSALEYLSLIVLGKTGIGAIFPYNELSNAAFLAISLVQYLAKELKLKISKDAKQTPEDIAAAEKAFA